MGQKWIPLCCHNAIGSPMSAFSHKRTLTDFLIFRLFWLLPGHRSAREWLALAVLFRIHGQIPGIAIPVVRECCMKRAIAATEDKSKFVASGLGITQDAV